MPEDLAKLTVKELKVRLKAKGLPVSGNKAALVARLQAPPSDDEDKGKASLWYEGSDGTIWTPTEDWRKNWRTYVTNVPEEYRDFIELEGGVAQYGVRSVAVLFVGWFLS